ncbi:hypothetical protein ABET52_03685 [Saccharococcus caldoxylosilyticus]|uniref:hypothetical protein n=1 Tax=Saccharococcus caldoxylosilyticus TaxID=81408 RepID=UPI0002E3B889|nr:hypothetical protein [Parageobacillus caldoxylosilyticus]BDG35420.1 hypothetical protein PcaKH15_13260 [Parageobacillus caldoxylosilyticus]BDG39198.1 hypothetical protein PcaKH16_13370 [Parageobacillus caldoxylosilyticus]BDG42981.1 hypothetical protein PcaKH35_13260 [Parageobacillus caldoxylosilyticus]
MLRRPAVQKAYTFGPSPWVFGGFMMAGLALSLVLSMFVPDTTKKVNSRYDESVNIVES